jgi:PAS domain S-box-containing protein
MQVDVTDSAREITCLQRCINDLVSLLALPAVWSGHEPPQILQILADALLRMLSLNFIYAQVNDPATEFSIDLLRVSDSYKLKVPPDEIRKTINQCISSDFHVPVKGNGQREEAAPLLPVPLGIKGEFGIMVVASDRPGFPTQTESLLLSVAAIQASIGLQEARLLGEQKRIANELEQRVADRTAGIGQANEELKKEIVERHKVEERLLQSEAALQNSFDEIKKSEAKLRRVIDTIPTLAWCNLADGPNEFLSKRWHEYTGLSPDESHGWGWQVVFHPEDLPPLVKRWQELLVSGEPGEIEARIRRHDGVYRWFLIRVEPFRDESGKIYRWYGTSTDIEDRKRAEEALKASERELRSIIDTVPTLAWSASPDGSADFLNRRWLDYTGLSHEEAQGWGWETAIHLDDVKQLLENWQAALASGEPVEAEARMRRFDGAYRWFLFRANPLRDESGKIVKWYGTNADIEDRKRVEEGLRASELSWRQIVDNIPGLVATMGARGEVEFLNRQTLAYFGRRSEDLKNWAFIGAVHPDDLPGVIEARRKSIEAGEIYDVEHRCRRADGVYRWFQVRGLPVRDTQGSIISWYLLLSDIEERKRAEEELRRSQDFLAEGQRLTLTGSFSWKLATDEITWSDQLYRIYEFDVGVPVTLDLIRTRVHPEDVSLIEKMKMVAQSEGDNDFEWHWRLKMPDDSIKYLHAVAHLTRDRSGQLEYIAAVQDVTARHLSQEALSRARSELAQVARVTSLGVLTASIAHEVNQPLSGIITNASTCLRMLSADPPNVEGARETARRTIRDGNRASDVITRVRKLYSKKNPQLEWIDLNDAAQEVTSLSLNELHRNRVILRQELAENLSLVMADRTQLQQVILNLLRNASDAMSTVEDRPRELVITTEQKDPHQVSLSVKDTGVGFTAQAADKLFEAFYTTKTDGIGIGLSLSQSIIAAHQGSLWAKPNEGPGATFSFTIPCQQRSSARIETCHNPQAPRTDAA